MAMYMAIPIAISKKIPNKYPHTHAHTRTWTHLHTHTHSMVSKKDKILSLSSPFSFAHTPHPCVCVCPSLSLSEKATKKFFFIMQKQNEPTKHTAKNRGRENIHKSAVRSLRALMQFCVFYHPTFVCFSTSFLDR